MTRRIRKPLPRESCLHSGATRWVLAGMLGIATAVLVQYYKPLPGIPEAGWALLALLAGCSVAVCFAPWLAVRRLNWARQTLLGLSSLLFRISRSDRDQPLRDLLVDTNDEIGDLSRTIHDTVTQLIAHRIESTSLQRKMDHSIQIATRRETSKLRREAATDPLTGLGNRRALEAHVRDLLQSGRTRPRHIVVAMMDFDFFKQINDTLGHEVGDQCLARFGRILRSSLRRDDCAVRVGGDEFIVVMPDLDADRARQVIDRITAMFRQMPWRHSHVPRPGVSVGLACDLTTAVRDPAELFRRADEDLYRMKRERQGSAEVA